MDQQNKHPKVKTPSGCMIMSRSWSLEHWPVQINTIQNLYRFIYWVVSIGDENVFTAIDGPTTCQLALNVEKPFPTFCIDVITVNVRCSVSRLCCLLTPNPALLVFLK